MNAGDDAGDPRTLSNAALDARLHALQARAFAIYDAAADAATPVEDQRMARAEAEVAPLIAEAKALSDERVRRLRARARAWRMAAIAVAACGAAVIVWLTGRA